MIKIKLEDYLKNNSPILSDINDAKAINIKYDLANTLDDIELIANKKILNVTRKYFDIILADRVKNYPSEKNLAKSIHIKSDNPIIVTKFKESIKSLITARQNFDKQLQIQKGNSNGNK